MIELPFHICHCGPRYISLHGCDGRWLLCESRWNKEGSKYDLVVDAHIHVSWWRTNGGNEWALELWSKNHRGWSTASLWWVNGGGRPYDYWVKLVNWVRLYVRYYCNFWIGAVVWRTPEHRAYSDMRIAGEDIWAVSIDGSYPRIGGVEKVGVREFPR